MLSWSRLLRFDFIQGSFTSNDSLSLKKVLFWGLFWTAFSIDGLTLRLSYKNCGHGRCFIVIFISNCDGFSIAIGLATAANRLLFCLWSPVFGCFFRETLLAGKRLLRLAHDQARKMLRRVEVVIATWCLCNDLIVVLIWWGSLLKKLDATIETFGQVTVSIHWLPTLQLSGPLLLDDGRRRYRLSLISRATRQAMEVVIVLAKEFVLSILQCLNFTLQVAANVVWGRYRTALYGPSWLQLRSHGLPLIQHLIDWLLRVYA